MSTDWNKRFVDLAQYVSGWSKDKSRGIGAIIADDEHRVISMGYNGFPAGCDDNIEARHERPLKYFYTEHAERNAIYNAAKNGATLNGSTMYLQWFPCADCARGIIQSGIKKVVCTEPDFTIPKWGESFKIGHEMLTEAKIEIEYVR